MIHYTYWLAYNKRALNTLHKIMAYEVASSAYNCSAMNFVMLFGLEVFLYQGFCHQMKAFDYGCGVYMWTLWPDLLRPLRVKWFHLCFVSGHVSSDESNISLQ